MKHEARKQKKKKITTAQFATIERSELLQNWHGVYLSLDEHIYQYIAKGKTNQRTYTRAHVIVILYSSFRLQFKAQLRFEISIVVRAIYLPSS